MNQRQQAILDFIREYPHQYPPTVREITVGVGFKSSASVQQHLVKLEEQGYIKRNPHCPRCIVLTDGKRGAIGDIVDLSALAVRNIADAEQQTIEPIIIMNDARKEINAGELEYEIECLRKRMHATALEKGMLHPDVLNISHNLNNVINELYKSVP